MRKREKICSILIDDEKSLKRLEKFLQKIGINTGTTGSKTESISSGSSSVVKY